MTITMVPMRWWHIDQVVGIDAELFGSTAWTAAQFWSELARANRYYIVLVKPDSGQQVLGYAGIAMTAPDADVQTIAVASAIQDQGWGRKLIARLVDIAHQGGCRRLMLEVRDDNTAALHLYTQQGFISIARRSSYYGPGADAIIMERDVRDGRE